MKKPWMFTGNTFDRATRTSNRKMLSIASRTNAKLAEQVSDPAIQIIYDEYNPVFVIYRDICNNYDVATGVREGKTFSLAEVLEDMAKVQIPLWEGKVRSIYAEGTAAELTFFPDHRNPFLKGNYEERIEAVNTLATKLAQDPSPVLTAYAPTVMSFYNMLLAARDTQVMKENSVEMLSTSRENQRKVLAAALYTVVAKLMVKYHNTPAMIDNFFDLSLIREKRNSFPATSIEVHGQVTASGTGEPVEGATVTVGKVNNPEPEVVTTDAEGRYKVRGNNLNQSDEGEVRLTVDVAGYQFFEFFFNVELGEVYTINPTVNPAMMKAA